MGKKNALVVDDERQMTAIISFALQTEGFNCYECHDGQSAWQAFCSGHFDLVVLDLMLPDISGITLCERIRAHSGVPILMLTALGDVEQRVAGLESGADDYLAKPFSPRELVLRASSLVRRSSESTTSGADDIVNHRMREDPLHGTVYIDDRCVEVSDIEKRLLRVLMQEPGRVFSVFELLNKVWGTTASAGGNSMVKTTIYRLRKRLDTAGVHSEVIGSVRGRGYYTPEKSQYCDQV
ncbi:MAG: response regulator transcription factor [Actinomycetaceae bacterium]|nr:response regulator transcription factor [Actinomycetaceae bacterium]